MVKKNDAGSDPTLHDSADRGKSPGSLEVVPRRWIINKPFNYYFRTLKMKLLIFLVEIDSF